MDGNMPEKIYLFDYNDALVTPLEGDTVYVREDSFIEKACKFISDRVDIPFNVECSNGEPLADSYIKYASSRLEAANKIIEDFKNYMKGE